MYLSEARRIKEVVDGIELSNPQLQHITQNLCIYPYWYYFSLAKESTNHYDCNCSQTKYEN